MAKHTRPLEAEDVERAFKPRGPAIRDEGSIFRHIPVAADEPPIVETRIERIKGRDGSITGFDVVVEIAGVRVGRRAFPAPIEGKGFRRGLKPTSEAVKRELLSAYVPDHLAFDPRPRRFARARRLALPNGSKVKRPTTVFAPDDRRVFQDTSYPWSTVGRVETPHGIGSGAMIGPRHLLTVSHVIDWNVEPPFAANWVKFTPSYYDGSEPFGHSYSTNIYWFNKDNGDNTIDATEEQFDYVVVVLGDRIGESTGWMGARGYSDDWDGLNVWSHMGYPSDLNSGSRPIFESPFPLDGSSGEPDAHEAILHTADVFPGQSGGPMFGWWDGDVGPRAVAVQSWQNGDTNGASGGGDLEELVIRARTDFA
jgi:V8-like Glu-specific endopeptidase